MKRDDDLKCLHYLSDKMEATGEMIGEAIAPGRATSPRGYAMIGNGVARRLWLDDRHLTTYLVDLHAWRITAAGREFLAEAQAPVCAVDISRAPGLQEAFGLRPTDTGSAT